ncbi:hypothetical protein ANO14919_112670 [Xylariales sp. No.14919]|nr:hypothetical protein ANO14919_112670 [Xylariales sp. No.14919]
MTKLLGEKERVKYAGDDCMILEAGKSLAISTTSKANSLAHEAESHCEEEQGEHTGSPLATGEECVQSAAEATKEKSSRLADLVISMTRDIKGRTTAREDDD